MGVVSPIGANCGRCDTKSFSTDIMCSMSIDYLIANDCSTTAHTMNICNVHPVHDIPLLESDCSSLSYVYGTVLD